jgi:hypothetical protein
VGWTILKLTLRGIRWGDMDWFDLAQDRDKWRAVVNNIKYWEVLE